jgi:L-iditol 2-dehydrogenase
MMKAAVVHQKNDLKLENLKIPEVPDGSIRINVKACAICGTDLRIYRKGDYRASYPIVPGHEIAGVVEAVSDGVECIKEGDPVCVAPGHGCGTCRMCLSGKPNVCTKPFPSLGYKVNGGFEEYCAVPKNIFRLGFVNPIPNELNYIQASMSEIVACCINAQNNVIVKEGDVVLIMGCGPAGIIHSHLAKMNGAAKVLITQRSAARLKMAAEKFDVIDRTITSTEEDLTKAVMDETNGEGADAIFVCAPSREAQELATELIGPRGRINFFGGLPKDDCIVELNANQLHYKECFISGASSSLPEDNRQALELLASRAIDPDKLITHVFPINDIHKGFDMCEKREGIKVVITF